MSTTLRLVETTGTAGGPAGGRAFNGVSGAGRTVCRVAGERIGCTLVDRALPAAAADFRVALAVQLPVTALVMLQQQRGFTAALSSIYGVDLARGFQRLACIRELHGTAAFLADGGYRREVLDTLCRRTLETSGLLVVRPARGLWRGDARVAAPREDETLALCHLFGSSGFAQLCDDRVLDEPVPLFLQPWCSERGLLPPQRLPRQTFSRSLVVRRLGEGRMILFEKAQPRRGAGR